MNGYATLEDFVYAILTETYDGEEDLYVLTNPMIPTGALKEYICDMFDGYEWFGNDCLKLTVIRVIDYEKVRRMLFDWYEEYLCTHCLNGDNINDECSNCGKDRQTGAHRHYKS